MEETIRPGNVSLRDDFQTPTPTRPQTLGTKVGRAGREGVFLEDELKRVKTNFMN